MRGPKTAPTRRQRAEVGLARICCVRGAAAEGAEEVVRSQKSEIPSPDNPAQASAIRAHQTAHPMRKVFSSGDRLRRDTDSGHYQAASTHLTASLASGN